jgi:hypothetical protein
LTPESYNTKRDINMKNIRLSLKSSVSEMYRWKPIDFSDVEMESILRHKEEAKPEHSINQT